MISLLMCSDTNQIFIRMRKNSPTPVARSRPTRPYSVCLSAALEYACGGDSFLSPKIAEKLLIAAGSLTRTFGWW
jgi:hypothetical protein